MYGNLPFSVHLKFIAERKIDFCVFFVASVVHIVCMLGPVKVLNLRFNIWDLTIYNDFYLTNRNGSLVL